MQSIFIKNRRNHTNLTTTWEQREFNSAFEILQNNTLSRAELCAENGVAGNVHYGDILVKYGEVLDLKTEALPYIQSKEIADKFKASLLRNGDVVIADTAEDETVGKCTEIANLGTFEVLAGLHTIPLRPKQKYAVGYLGYYMNSNSFHDTLLPLMQGTKVTSISKSALQGTTISYPTDYSEQQQIGSYFRNLDNLITLHQRSYNLEQKSKTTNAWEQRKLGECFDERTERSADGELIAVTINSGVVKASELNRHDNSSEDKSNYKVVRVNDIAYNSMRMWQGASGYSQYDGILSPAYTVVIPRENVNPVFFSYMFKRTDMIHEFQINSQGLTSDTWNLKFPAFSTISANVPKSEEQQAIGNYFTNLDNLITLHQRKPFQRKNGGKNYVRRC